MGKELNKILKQALAPENEPARELNQRIIAMAEGRKTMANNKKKRIPAAILVAAFTLMLGSVAVVAAAHYLSPKQVAEELEDKKLMDAFEGEDAVLVNETQECGGYRVTLLGAVSGENISSFLSEDSKGVVKSSRFYAAVAIERVDGSPMPDTSEEAYGEEDFYVSPYIKGLEPWNYGVMNIGGGYSAFVEDGIHYRLLDMENIEMFADRGIYIGVNSGSSYDAEAYLYDESTGEISRNTAYDRVNALFTLPLDPSKGDEEAAKRFLESLEEEEEEEEPVALSEKEQEVENWMEQFTQRLHEGKTDGAKRVESTVQTCKVDDKGYISYDYTIGDGGSGSGSVEVKEIFQGKEAGTMETLGYSGDGTLEGLRIEVVTLNEDGTVTFAIYEVE